VIEVIGTTAGESSQAKLPLLPRTRDRRCGRERDHHPIKNLRSVRNCVAVSGLVKMSAQLRSVSTFSTWILPDRIWSLKWCSLIDKRRVHGPMSEVVSFGDFEASSIIIVDGRLHLSSGYVSFEVFEIVDTMWLKEPFGERVHIVSAMYSALQVLSAISDSSLLTQWIRQPE